MNILLYCCVCLVWGATWFAIKLQLGTVPVLWSVIYRFGLASAIFFFMCYLKNYSLRFNKQQHFVLVGLGLTLFSTNYILFYLGTTYLISGLVAMIGAFITVLNVLNSRIFLKTMLNFVVVLGSLFGLLGLFVVFSAHGTFNHSGKLSHILLGFSICVVAAYIASVGNVLAAYNRRTKHIPIMPMNAYGMLYGTLFMIIVALISRQPFVFDTSVSYVTSLLFLSLLGSVFAFQIYLFLLSKMGPEKVGYVYVITPILALIVSSWFEAFDWTLQVIIGMSLVIIGNVLVLFQKRSIAHKIPKTDLAS